MLTMDWDKTDKNLLCSLPLPEGCRTLILRGDIIKDGKKQLYISYDGRSEPRLINQDRDLWVITNISPGSGIIVNRKLGLREDESLPVITWSIKP